MNYNNFILAFVIIILFLYFYNSTLYTSEKMSNSSNYIESLSKDISSFITKDTTYSEYLDFLKSKSNKSYNIISQETFFELKFMAKKNTLTPQVVAKYINDV